MRSSTKELDAQVGAAGRRRKPTGRSPTARRLDPLTMFEDVFREMPPNLQREREDMRALRSSADAAAPAPPVAGRLKLMPQMNMVQALNSAMDVDARRAIRAWSCSARTSATSAACSA